MKHYQNSLENITLARIESTFRNDANLDERESCCREYLKLKNISDAEDIFKLSYDPHPRIPFLVNGLELSENDKFGRYIKTNRDLRPGDVIATEEPFLKFIDFKAMHLYKYQRCFNCFKSNKLNLRPGPHSVMSCSQSCHDSTMEKDLESEALIDSELDWKLVKMMRIKDCSLAVAGNADRLKELYYGQTKTLFDFDLNGLDADESRKRLLKCCVSLIGGTNGGVDNNSDVFKLMIGSYNEPYRVFLMQFVDHMMNVCRKTQFSLNIFDESVHQFEKIGNCLLPFGGLLNHSCDPNIFWICANGKFVYIVAKPIRAGEQLFICYRKTFLRESLADRQKALLKQYGFKCDCQACIHDYQMQASVVDSRQIVNLNDIASIRSEVTKNWIEIESDFDKEKPLKTAELIGKN